MEGQDFHAPKTMQPCWYHSQLWQNLHHEKSKDNILAYWFFFSPWQYAYESTTGRIDIFPFSLETTGVFNPRQGKKETNDGYFLWTLLLNIPPTRNKRMERTEISTVWMTVLSHCLQFILSSFTRYCGTGIQKVLYCFMPGNGRSKYASCGGARTNSSVSPFTHS